MQLPGSKQITSKANLQSLPSSRGLTGSILHTILNAMYSSPSVQNT